MIRLSHQSLARQIFFQAYIAAVKQGMLDHIVENEELVAVIDDVYRWSIQDVYNVSQTD